MDDGSLVTNMMWLHSDLGAVSYVQAEEGVYVLNRVPPKFPVLGS